MDINFGYEQVDNSNNTEPANVNDGKEQVTDIDTNKLDNDKKGEKVDELDFGDGNDTNKNKDTNDKDNDTKSEYEEGTSIEVDNNVYTIDKDGNAVDKDGNIFKEAKDVKAWLEEFDKVDDTDDSTMSISNIQKLIGIDITDENDKPVEFENTTEGIKSYIDAVTETVRNEAYDTAINTLYQKYPILENVLNYYVANGNSLEGFMEIPDRSNISIDDTNEAQQESIIRTAWKEQNRRGNVDSYIQYLKSSGTLLATAKEELAGLQESDKQYREELAAKAQRQEEERIKELENYWNGVHEVIKTRSIAGYQIPESIIINRNGQKLSVTPEDFYNYLYRVDKDGHSAYERDLMSKTKESRRDDEILRAYLTFVGGDYSNLVDMAINKEKVAKLRFKAKERNTTSVRITKPNNNDKKEINFGY